MIRGLDTVDEIIPKLGLFNVQTPALQVSPPAKSELGFPNLGVLVKLKNSARTCRPLPSVIAKLRWIARSRFSWLGPRKMPTPQLPKPVPSPITGGGANAATLK